MTDFRISRATLRLLLVPGLFAQSVAFGEAVAAQSGSFSGETVAIEVGYGPGGGYDTYARILAKHYGRFIAGNPSVVARNMPGAGSLRAANFIYNLAPRDGTELGAWASSTVMEPLLGNDLAKFEATKFGWIGSMNQDISFCGVWQAPGAATSFQDMLTKETIFGSAGAASISYQHPLVLKNLLGANARVVTGYAGAKEVNLAMQRGEVNGSCGLFVSSIKSQWLKDVQEGRLKLVIQMGPRTTSEFGNVPSAFDYVKSEDDRKVLELHFKQILLGRPLAGPPGMPAERLAALRTAFLATMKDPEFLADAGRANIDIDPVTAEQVEKLLGQFADYPRSIIDKARAVIGR
jgi:tripartite-type tricarboxylate transporter receptor subunit TctC